MKYESVYLRICFMQKLEQGLGPDFEDMDCVGTTPLQTDDPSEICFAIGG